MKIIEMLEMPGNLEFLYATEDDLKDIFEIVDLTGWGETFEDIQRVIQNPDNTYIAVYDNETSQIIGIILSVANNDIGFIGHVIVRSEYRKMGIGQELMLEAIKDLKFKGCKTIKLDAVEKAITLYERVGFTFEYKSLRYLKEITSKADVTSLIEKCSTVEQEYPVYNCKEDDLSDIFEIDHEIFGANRDNFLMGLFEDHPEYCFVVRDTDDCIKGYLFATYREGFLKLRAGISDSYATTMNLFKAAFLTAQKDDAVKYIKVGLVENSQYGVQILELLEFEKIGFSYRMYWGQQTEKGNNPKIFAIGDPAKG